MFKNSVGFIGTGKMATAIITGIYDQKLDLKIYGYDINKNNYDFLKSIGLVVCNSSADLVKNCKYIVLATKPQEFSNVLQEIKDVIDKNNVIVSIAAGKSEKNVADFLKFNLSFIRVMPNTPLLIGEGAVAMSRGSVTLKEDFNFVKKIFSSTAEVYEISEKHMNDIIAINGSSPAYIYLFAKGFLKFAEKAGIDYLVALNLFCKTLIGTAKMMKKSGKTIDELIADVTSKGGTTEAGVASLNNNKFIDIIEKVCEQTKKRADELSD